MAPRGQMRRLGLRHRSTFIFVFNAAVILAIMLGVWGGATVLAIQALACLLSLGLLVMCGVLLFTKGMRRQLTHWGVAVVLFGIAAIYNLYFFAMTTAQV